LVAKHRLVANRFGATLMRIGSRGGPLHRRALRRLGRILFVHTLTTDEGFVMTAYGVWLRQRPEDRTFTFCLMATYGFFFSDYIAERREPFVFLDVGANAGLYSVIAARNSSVQAVHSIEPDPATLPYLRANLARAVDPGRWTVHPVALSDHDGSATLSTSSQHSGVATLRSNALDEMFDDEVTVQTRDHAYLDEAIGAPTSRVLVKIDVEGHELSALRALAAWNGWRSVTAVYLEVDKTFADTGPVLALLDSEGFKEEQRVGGPEHYDALYARAVAPSGL
jgi:FkbM family methyltransferase